MKKTAKKAEKAVKDVKKEEMPKGRGKESKGLAEPQVNTTLKDQKITVKVVEIPKDQPIPETKQTIVVKVEQPKKEVLWITVAFTDGTHWKFPASMVIRKAMALSGQVIKSTEESEILKYASEKMDWQEVRQKAIGIVNDEMPDYIKEFKKAVKGVIYG